ncbi:MAG: ribonuclease Z [Chloroflexi bacterium]|nr:ribonuclease Z [Chloroflexota bacterium]
MIDVCLAGTGAMMPLPGRWLSSLAVRTGPQSIIFDCGEGTQITWKMLGWGFRRLRAIAFSHYDADHVMGLVGVLFCVAHANRTEELTIVGPVGMQRVLAGVRAFMPGQLPFPVTAVELRGGERLEVAGLTLSTLSLQHRIPCLGYTLEVARRPRFDPVAAEMLGLPKPLWGRLQRGEPVEHEGRSVAPEEVLGPSRRGLKLGFVTDSRPLVTIPPFVAGADLFVCEGTYGSDVDRDKAEANRHMTFAEAAALARDGGVRQLWLTHFGAGLTEPELFVDEARAIFPRTVVGHDRLTTSLTFD